MINPDGLLLGYAEALTLLGSARAQRLSMQFGEILETKCTKTRACAGHPHREAEGWKCSTCRKPWTTEPAELGVNEEGKRTGGTRWRESPLYARMLDFGRVLDQVERELPWPFTAWCVYKLHPGPSLEALFGGNGVARGTPTLGVHQDQVAGLMLGLESRGILHGVPRPTSHYRVKSWIRQARDRTSQLAMMRGV
jgi:hypothetical protein